MRLEALSASTFVSGLVEAERIELLLEERGLGRVKPGVFEYHLDVRAWPR